MWEFLATPEARAIILVWVFLLLSIVGFYVVMRFRNYNEDDTPKANELLTNFREMHLEGDIDEEEFRNIKTQLSDRLQEEASVAKEDE